MKKLVSLALVLMMLLGCLAGCGSNNSGSNGGNTANNGGSAAQNDNGDAGDAGEATIGSPDAPVDVKVLVKDVFPDEEDVQLLVQAINEKMAAHGQYVNVMFVEPPAGEYPTALPLAVMNGEIDADLIYFQGGDQAVADQGLLEDLTPYIENSTYVKALMDETNVAKLESYPYLLWLSPPRTSTPVMRSDWAEQLESYDALMADPTVDNYYNLFKEMKDKGLVEYALTADGDTTTLIGTQNLLDYNALAQLDYTALQYATIIVAIIPILLIYPLVLKYYTKDTLAGGVKG